MTETSSSTRVSVVIPTYNRAHLVCDAIKSALAQTVVPDEIIVIDDGSTDDTESRVRSLGSGLVRYVRQENAGVSAARNKGIQNARGEFIAFLDSDDLWLPEKIERQLPLFSCPEIGFTSTNAYVLDQSGQKIGTYWDRRPISEDDAFSTLLRSSFLLPSMTMVRASCFRQTGGFDEALSGAEDRDLWLRLSRRFKLRLTREPLALWRKQQGSLTTNDFMMLSGDLRVFEKWRSSKDLKPSERRLVRRQLAKCHFDLAYGRASVDPSLALRHIVSSLKFGPFRPRTYRALLTTSIRASSAAFSNGDSKSSRMKRKSTK